MSTHFTLDGESFQNLLARAFLAQEYLESQKAQRPSLDLPPKPAITEQPKDAIPPDYIQSLFAIVEVQRLIATCDLEVDGTMALIAERARKVSSASGVAIGLLEGDELVYRAGSGSAAAYIGRHVKATLNVSAQNRASGEILRVENAETDRRIEAAICRQFGAKALLIVPICYHRAVAGAVEILFAEAHTFQDHEVRTYQLMAGLIAEAMSHAAQFARKQVLAAERTKEHPLPAETPEAAEVEAGELSLFGRLAWAVAMVTQGATRFHLHQSRWKMAAVITVLVIAGWIGSMHRSPPSAPAKLVPANSRSKPQTARLPTQEKKKKAARTTSQRLRVWRDVDYVAENVTVRYFKPKPAVAPPKEPVGTAAQGGTTHPDPVVVHAADEPGIKQSQSKK